MTASCSFLNRPLDDVTTSTAFDGQVFALATDVDLRWRWSVGRPLGAHSGAHYVAGADVPGLLAATGTLDERVAASMLAALDGHETTYVSTHGDVRFENRVGPQHDHEGRVCGTVTIVVDVTGSESARMREQRAEERFRRLVDHSPALIGIRDADEAIVHANPSFLHTFAEGVGAPTSAATGPPPEDANLHATVRTVLESGEPRVWEGEIPHPGGHHVHLLGHVFPLPLVDGTSGVGEVFLDLSPQDQALRGQAASEQRYRAIFDGAEICIILLDSDGRIVDANAASTRLTGRSRSELRGRFVGLLTTHADTQAHQPLWNELRAGRRSRYDRPMTLRHADGRLYPAHLTMTLIRDADGRPDGALGLATPLPIDGQPIRGSRGQDLVTAADATVLERLAAGMTLQQIADELGLTRRGVDYRVAQLRRKLRPPGTGDVPRTPAALVGRAYALGIMHPSTWPPRVVRLRPIDDGTGA